MARLRSALLLSAVLFVTPAAATAREVIRINPAPPPAPTRQPNGMRPGNSDTGVLAGRLGLRLISIVFAVSTIKAVIRRKSGRDE